MHKYVVDLIKASGDTLQLTVIAVNDAGGSSDGLDGSGGVEAEQQAAARCVYDYSEKRILPISIPDYFDMNRDGQRFVVYNVYMAGRHLCSRRYNEFYELHERLKVDFADFGFPPFPGKSLFALNEKQLDKRRRELEQYLEKVCAVRPLAESDLMQHFLTSADDSVSP